jgi:hypothetical protein
MIQYPPNCFEQIYRIPQLAGLKEPFLASSTNKKVHIQRFDRESLAGFVNLATYQTPAGIELLQRSGTVLVVPYPEIKTVYFVRDFPAGEPVERRSFLNRPKLDGLWVRLTFRDHDALEGVMQNDLLQLSGSGFHIIPPERTLHAFIPKAALLEVQVLGVVGSPLRAGRRKKPPTKEQIGLFEEQA